MQSMLRLAQQAGGLACHLVHHEGQQVVKRSARLLVPTCFLHLQAPHFSAESAPVPVSSQSYDLSEDEESTADLTPLEVVDRLDRFIVGQADAKRAVANALRNRWRRHRIESPMKEEIVPKNILMIGPTGCGKTEIARRLARLADAPFVKVEATKFTEVGFHGRDVDQIIRDLVDNAQVMVKQKQRRKMRKEVDLAVENRLLDALCGDGAAEGSKAAFRDLLRRGELDNRNIKIDASTPRSQMPQMDGFAGLHEVMIKVDKLGFLGSSGRAREEKREMTIAEARPLVEAQEEERLISNDTVQRDAIAAVEQDGIVFIDEIDKIVVSQDTRYGADASSEGVQRDLLPIIEGSVVSTKSGNVNTDHILFICSGAFHSCKPSDMLAELQGRLPIRVELKGLSAADFYRILTEPEHNMLKQQKALLATEGVDLVFTDDAVHEVACVAEEVNTSVDNIGARRLHTVLERILDEISFQAPQKAAEAGGAHQIVIDRSDVVERVSQLLKKQDLSKYVL